MHVLHSYFLYSRLNCLETGITSLPSNSNINIRARKNLPIPTLLLRLPQHPINTLLTLPTPGIPFKIRNNLLHTLLSIGSRLLPYFLLMSHIPHERPSNLAS